MKNRTLVVIPTLNEEASIVKIIANIQSNITGADILVVDGYSKDLTVQKAKSKGAKVIQVDKSFGIGLAIETAILFAFLFNGFKSSNSFLYLHDELLICLSKLSSLL